MNTSLRWDNIIPGSGIFYKRLFIFGLSGFLISSGVRACSSTGFHSYSVGGSLTFLSAPAIGLYNWVQTESSPPNNQILEEVTLSVPDGSTVQSANSGGICYSIISDNNNTGNVYFNGSATILGVTGGDVVGDASNNINTIKASGGSSSILAFNDTIYAENLIYSGAGTVLVSGNANIGTINFQSNNGTFTLSSGKNIVGNITSTGNGILNLGGNNTISGNIAASSSIQNIVLSGNAQLGSNSSTNYTLSTKNLNIGGNVLTVYGNTSSVTLQGTTSPTYSFIINSDRTYGYISFVSAEAGSFSAPGDLSIDLTGVSHADNGDKFTIVQGGVSSTSIGGATNIITDLATAKVTPFIENNNLVLLVALKNVVNEGVSGTQFVMTNTLNSIPALGSDLSNILTIINLMTPTQASNAYLQMSPSKLGGVTSRVVSNLGGQFGQAISSHLSSATSGISSGDYLHTFSEKEGGIWGRFLEGNAKQSTFDSIGYTDKMSGAIFGADLVWMSKFRAGISLGYSKNHIITEDNSSIQDIRSLRSLLYGRRDLKNYYLEGIVGSIWSHYDQSRFIVFPGVSRVAFSSYHGADYSISLSSGRAWNYNHWQLTPNGTVRYSLSRMNAYTEDGAGDLNLRTDKQNSDALQTEIGINTAYSINHKRIQWIPKVQIKWTHDYLSMTQNTNNSFVAGGDVFLVTGPRSVRNTYSFGAGVTSIFAKNVRFDLDYNLDRKTHYHSNTFSLMGRYQF